MTRILLIIFSTLLLCSCSQSDERVKLLKHQIEITSHTRIGGYPKGQKFIYPKAGDTLTCDIETVDVFTSNCKQKLSKNAFQTLAFNTMVFIDPEYEVKILVSKIGDTSMLNTINENNEEVRIRKLEGEYWELIK